MSDYFTILTLAGEAKLAAAASGGPVINLAKVAVGDGGGTAYTPNQGQTALTNETYRASIASAGYAAPNLIVIEAVISANTPDAAARPSGGWNIVEAGVFDSTGTMIAIAKMPVRYKPLPTSGAAEDMTIRLVLAISNAASVVVNVDSSGLIALNRLDRMPFIAVDSATTSAPPTTPEIGATYLLPSGSTGVWGGQDGKIAHWNGAAWIIITPYTRTVVGVADARAFLEFDGANWVSFVLPAIVNTVTATATLTAGQFGGTLLVNASSGNIVLTLPAASVAQTRNSIKIKRTDSTANTVTIKPYAASSTSSDLFQPGGLGLSTSLTLGQNLNNNPALVQPGETLSIFSDGASNWYGGIESKAPRISAWGYGTGNIGSGGSATFYVPPFVQRIDVRDCIAGGGSGGGWPGSTYIGSSGGGGGWAKGPIIVTPGQSIAITVGAGGVAATYYGNAGGSSSVGSFMSATGGAGGRYGNPLSGGLSGQGSGGAEFGGLGDGDCGGLFGNDGTTTWAPGKGGGPGGQSGTSGGFAGQGPGGGGGGTGLTPPGGGAGPASGAGAPGLITMAY